MARDGGTRVRIQQVARELFAGQGVRRTSLQEIADRLGMTKPALYYHFASREQLVRSIVQPVVDEGEEFLIDHEHRPTVVPRALFEEYFDYYYRHREVFALVLAELGTLQELGLLEVVMDWRKRLIALLAGPDAPLEQATRAAITLGGLQDCTLQFPDAPGDELRRAAVDAACLAYGVS